VTIICTVEPMLRVVTPPVAAIETLERVTPPLAE
jgi:hypothetical protein